jgi:membrane-associated phospholipid phosphatase
MRNPPAGNARAISLTLTWVALLLVSYFYNISLFRLINGHYTEFGDWFFSLITCLGDGLVLGIFLFFLWPRSAVHAVLGLESLIVSGILAQILKNSLAVPRPPAVLDQVHIVGVEYFKSSFPSGHTASAFAVGYLLYVYYTHRVWKALVIVSAVLVGYSRVYLGLHFPLDVVAGAGIGLLCTKLSLRHKIAIQGWLDTFSDNHRKIINRIMMGILVLGGLVLVSFYNQLTNAWFGNFLGIFALGVGLFFLLAAPESV